MTAPLTSLTAPTPDLLYIGKGVLYLTDHASGLSWHVGNATRVEINTSDEVVDKYSSMEASAPIYARRLQRRTVTIGITLDEYDKNNIAAALMGEHEPIDQPVTPVVDQVVGTAAIGGQYRVPAYNLEGVAVTLDAGGTPMVLTTDYEWVNKDIGLFRLLEPSSVWDPGDELTASYTPTAFASTLIRGGVTPVKQYGALFIGDPSAGPPLLVEVFNCTLAPTAPFQLISEDYAPIELEGAIQSDAAGQYGGSEDSPLYNVIGLPAAA
jgi:hypothetical protein